MKTLCFNIINSVGSLILEAKLSKILTGWTDGLGDGGRGHIHTHRALFYIIFVFNNFPLKKKNKDHYHKKFNSPVPKSTKDFIVVG